MLAEFERLRQHSAATPQEIVGRSVTGGELILYSLVEKGTWDEIHSQICPRTCHVLRGLGQGHGGSVCESQLGSAHFAVLSPGVTVSFTLLHARWMDAVHCSC
jgi:hypothetical protein